MPILLFAVVSTPTTVVIHLQAVRNDVTDALDAEYESALRAWSCRAERRLGEGPAPAGLSLLGEIDVVLSDDVGTPYRRAGRQWMADGAEWETVLRFQPAIAKQARSVTVAIDSERGRERPFVLAL